MMYSEEESLSIGKNTGGNLPLIIEEDRGTFPMIIRALLLPTGEDRQCHLVVTPNERTFGRTILPCGLHSKAQEDRLGLTKDSEKATLNSIDFTVTGHQVEGVTLKETLEVNECTFL